MVAALLVLICGEWLRVPGWGSLVVALGLLGLLAFLSRPWNNWRLWAALAGGTVALAGMLLVQLRLGRLASDWETIRHHRVTDSESESARELTSLRQDALVLADTVLGLGDGDRSEVFSGLERLVAGDAGLTVSLLDSLGQSVGWAGETGWASTMSSRPQRDTTLLVRTPYYLTLEAWRHSSVGAARVARLLWADPMTGRAAASFADGFTARTGVELVPLEDSIPGLAVVSPEVGAARRAVVVQGRTVVSWAIVSLVVFGAMASTMPVMRYLLLFALLPVFIRAPLGASLGAGELFSPATFFRPVAGPLSSSVGLLAISGTLLTLVSVGLWRLRLPRTWYGVLIGVAALAVAPDVYREVGRGITPPFDGVSLPLWITWQLAMVVTAAGLISLAAALFRGRAETGDGSWKWWLLVGVLMALAATLVGTYVWRPSPRIGWPPWYTTLWIPPLLLVARPAPRWATASAIALASAAAASLITWGAVREGSLAVARRDIERLGVEPDPLAVRSLELLADDIAADPPPTNSAALYRTWYGSDLAEEGHPAVLGLWSDEGIPRAEVALDSLTVASGDVAELVRNLEPSVADTVMVIPAVPGVHYLLLVRVPTGVATVMIGPRTRLLNRTRLGWLLDRTSDQGALYDISLTAPAAVADSVPLRGLTWRREGWRIFGEADIAYPDGVSRVQATVDLRGPLPVWTRGALLVVLDVALLLALWGVGELLAGGRLRLPEWRRMRRSFRLRLAVALAGFFVLPAVGFATWSFFRLASESRQERDAVTTRIVRDGASLVSTADVGDSRTVLARVGSDLDAELWLYGSGYLMAVTSPVLEQLGLVPPLVPASVYREIGVGPAVETIAPADLGLRRLRVNYRAASRAQDQALNLLAAPQLLARAGLAQRQRDLAYLVLLATVLGLGAALAAARWVALALSRPVADLRRSAVAIGRGGAMPAVESAPPLEFEPVFGAFARMAVDIRESQQALEEARRRTAAVLATVPIGVLAVDREGRVLMANGGAQGLIGVALPPATLLSHHLDSEWQVLMQMIVEGDAGTEEITVGDRRVAVQLASMGGDLGGAVVALSDITEVSRAERVLAWGEMARQVAHEIKNPLTPMRLGMQHLQRVYRNRPQQFGADWNDTSARILSEIDRLDRIARAFSRFGSPGDGDTPLDRIDLAETAREVVQLYGAADGTEVVLSDVPGSFGMARRDEVKEVLLNLIENARQAGAASIGLVVAPGRIEVKDDGPGIAAEDLPQVFEPHFSTTSSGSGLGLAIVRRLVESWRAEVKIESEPGQGTRVTVFFDEGSDDDPR